MSNIPLLNLAKIECGYGDFKILPEHIMQNEIYPKFVIMQKEWKEQYKLYLESDQWKILRQKVLERDNHICCKCGGKANQVHHEKYNLNVWIDVPMKYLKSTCKDCHKILDKERKEKYKNQLGIKPYDPVN